jgi:hypothetical protein
MQYVYSTLTCDNDYAEWAKNGDQQSILRTVRVNGGHGLMNKHMITPLGVVTEVSDEDLEFLQRNSAFRLHVENGFITVDEKKAEPEKVAANMKRRDKSSQIVPSDYEKGGMMDVPEPKVGGV